MIKKILVDECLSPKASRAIQAFADVDTSADAIKVVHLRADLQFGAVDDEVWTRQLKPASHWLVVTSDYGSQKQGGPLPKIAAELNLPLLVLYGKLGERKMIERTRALLAMWPDISGSILPLRDGRRWRIVCRARSGYHLQTWDERQTQRFFNWKTSYGNLTERKGDRG